jgi:hypothetical protein
VIVHDLDPVRSVGHPEKANPPPVVDADAVLLLSIGFQCFQVVAWRHTQATEFRGGLNLKQLAPRDALDVAEAEYRTAVKEGLGFGTRKRANDSR